LQKKQETLTQTHNMNEYISHGENEANKSQTIHWLQITKLQNDS